MIKSFLPCILALAMPACKISGVALDANFEQGSEITQVPVVESFATVEQGAVMQAAPISTPTSVNMEQPPALPTSFPSEAPYPTPDTWITAWAELINQASIADIQWETHTVEIPGNVSGNRYRFAFTYPAGWHIIENGQNPVIQNIPQGTGSEVVEEEFVKFTLNSLDSPPVMTFDENDDTQQFFTVALAGESGVLRLPVVDNTWSGGWFSMSVIWQHDGEWFALVGGINLPQESAYYLERDISILLAMFASLAPG